MLTKPPESLTKNLDRRDTNTNAMIMYNYSENKFMGEGKGKDAGFVVGLGRLALNLRP